MEDAIKGVQVSYVRKHDPDNIEINIVKILANMILMHRQEWSPEMFTQTVNVIIGKYWFLKLEEIAMIIDQLANGQIKVFGKIAPTHVMQALHEYDISDDKINYYSVVNVSPDPPGLLEDKEARIFNEIDKRKSIRINQQTQNMIEKFTAAKEAKKQVDGE